MFYPIFRGQIATIYYKSNQKLDGKQRNRTLATEPIFLFKSRSLFQILEYNRFFSMQILIFRLLRNIGAHISRVAACADTREFATVGKNFFQRKTEIARRHANDLP